jgi:hypothetical protein
MLTSIVEHFGFDREFTLSFRLHCLNINNSLLIDIFFDNWVLFFEILFDDDHFVSRSVSKLFFKHKIDPIIFWGQKKSAFDSSGGPSRRKDQNSRFYDALSTSTSSIDDAQALKITEPILDILMLMVDISIHLGLYVLLSANILSLSLEDTILTGFLRLRKSNKLSHVW